MRIIKPYNLLKRLTAAFCMFAAVYSCSTVHAEQTSPRFRLPYIGGNLGVAEVDNDNFDHSTAISGYGGFYLFNNFSVEAWTVYLGEFALKGRDDTYLEVSGVGATVAYRIDMGRLFALRPSVGLFYSHSESVYEGEKIGDDDGADLMFGLTGVFTIKEHVLINVNTHVYKDVSGSDIVLFSTGAGYQF